MLHKSMKKHDKIQSIPNQCLFHAVYIGITIILETKTQKMRHLSILVLALVAISFTSCFQDNCTSEYTYTLYEPIYMSPEDMRSAISLEDPRELENVGKLYFYSNYFFVNEIGKGIHIFDNTDSSNPIPFGFLNVPGNYDMAIKNNMMYVDNSLDLITIDISNINNPVVVDIDEEVYQMAIYEQGIVLYYKESEQTIEVDCQEVSPGDIIFLEDGGFARNIDFNLPVLANDAASAGEAGQTGIGGSFARFTINQNHLYTVDLSSLNTWSLEQCENPQFLTEQSLDWGVETIFAIDDRIFVGSDSGVFIFDNSNPSSPVFESEFIHARACDPVFVEGDIAYVTLRNGNQCAGFINQLDIIDVSDLRNPQLIDSHEMMNPHGLSVKDKIVFLCEGTDGLKIIDATNPNQLSELKHISDFHAYDIIRLANNIIMIIGDDGFYQYRFDQNYKLELLSHIPTI